MSRKGKKREEDKIDVVKDFVVGKRKREKEVSD
jgi:hypothetical protein